MDGESTVVTVYYCPNDQPTDRATSSCNYRVTSQTTFLELQRNVCTYYSEEFAESTLKDEFGTNWPARELVAAELRKFDRDIRLCLVDTSDETVSKEVVEEVQVEEEEDDSGPKSARPPNVNELYRHLVFITILLVQTYTHNLSVRFNLHRTFTLAFLDPVYVRSPDGNTISGPSITETFYRIDDSRHMCTWLADPFPAGIWATDFSAVEVSGSIMGYNRLISGLELRITTENFVSAEELYFNGTRPKLERNTRTIPIMPESYPDGWMVNQSVLLPHKYVEYTSALCGEYADEFDIAEDKQLLNETEILTDLELAFVLYNHNVNYYADMVFRFVLDKGGAVIPTFSINFFKLNNGPSGWVHYDIVTIVRDLGLWLLIANYALVFLRTRNELKAAYKLWKDRGTLRPYFTGVFNLLELTNLTLNYSVLSCRIIYAFWPYRNQFVEMVSTLSTSPHTEIDYESIRFMATIYGLTDGLTACSIVTASILLFRYFELAPKRSLFYLTSTSIGRAGADTSRLTIFVVYLTVAITIIGHAIFGSNMEEFCTFLRSFFTICQMLAGSGEIYFRLTRVFPITGSIFFFFCHLMVMIIITPLYLAIINEAYAIRSLHLAEIEARRQQRLREAAIGLPNQKGQMLDKSKFAAKPK